MIFVCKRRNNAASKLLAVLRLPRHSLLPSLTDPLQDILPILVQLQLGDDTFGRVDANSD